MSANKILPIFAGLILLMLVFIGMKSFNKKSPELTLQTVPVAPMPDADSPADTVRTLTSHVAEVKGQYSYIQQQNAELLNQKNDLASSLKVTLTEELQKLNQGTNPQVNALSAEVSALKAKLETVAHPQDTFAGGDNSQQVVAEAVETMLWVEPLGALPSTHLANASLDSSTLNPMGSTLNPPATGSSLGGAPALAPSEPAYTIPRNATLIGSTAMTALIGRVPFKGQIQDPFPFKVIVGRDNLAANGIDIPGLDGMVFSGHSSGDWTLGCVRGNVDSATFVFDDGTIRTVSANSQSGNGSDNAATGANNVNNMLGNGGSGNSSGANASIGWISDKRGIPCVSGERISNASEYLWGRIAAGALGSGAKSLAQTNVTQSATPVGGVLSAVTGNAAEYTGLNAIAGGFAELGEYIKERAAQSFDVIYVDTGVELALHIDRELALDYDPSGRKTTYEANNNAQQVALD